MSRRRAAVAVVLGFLVVYAVAQTWVNGHTVDLVVVNASGTPVEIAWQPAPYLGTQTAFDDGCASHSIPLSRGQSWRVTQDGIVVLDSSDASLPVLSSLVAVEVWLDPDGSVRIVPAHEVARLVDAPYPSCENTPG